MEKLQTHLRKLHHASQEQISELLSRLEKERRKFAKLLCVYKSFKDNVLNFLLNENNMSQRLITAVKSLQMRKVFQCGKAATFHRQIDVTNVLLVMLGDKRSTLRTYRPGSAHTWWEETKMVPRV